MNKSQQLLLSFFHAFTVVAYVVTVIFIMLSGQELFSADPEDILTPIAILLLFTVSVAITGIVIFGKPVLLFLDGNKQDAITFLMYTVGWLFVMTTGYLLTLALM